MITFLSLNSRSPSVPALNFVPADQFDLAVADGLRVDGEARTVPSRVLRRR